MARNIVIGCEAMASFTKQITEEYLQFLYSLPEQYLADPKEYGIMEQKSK